MRVLISEFISLDGVVQAPGGADEDTSGGFQHGGWSMPYFDPDVMGTPLMEAIQQTDAMLQGRRTYQGSAAAWGEGTDDGEARPFELVSTLTANTGVLVNGYRRAR